MPLYLLHFPNVNNVNQKIGAGVMMEYVNPQLGTTASHITVPGLSPGSSASDPAVNAYPGATGDGSSTWNTATHVGDLGFP